MKDYNHVAFIYDLYFFDYRIAGPLLLSMLKTKYSSVDDFDKVFTLQKACGIKVHCGK